MLLCQQFASFMRIYVCTYECSSIRFGFCVQRHENRAPLDLGEVRGKSNTKNIMRNLRIAVRVAIVSLCSIDTINNTKTKLLWQKTYEKGRLFWKYTLNFIFTETNSSITAEETKHVAHTAIEILYCFCIAWEIFVERKTFFLFIYLLLRLRTVSR